MNQADADRLDKLAKAYSTNASYCCHMAAGARNRSSKEHWVRLAGVWTTLAGGHGKVALHLRDARCPTRACFKTFDAHLSPRACAWLRRCRSARCRELSARASLNYFESLHYRKISIDLE